MKRDWDMNRADLHEIQELELVDSICRTAPPFHEIDLDGNGRVNKREFLLHAASMKQMPPKTEFLLQEQHGFKTGRAGSASCAFVCSSSRLSVAAADSVSNLLICSSRIDTLEFSSFKLSACRTS